jgi:SET domain-containing protein
MKSVQVHPDGLFYSIPELEEKIPFKYLSSLMFEDQAEVLARGQDKHQNNQVSLESQKLGKKFIEKIEAAYIPLVSVRWISDQVGYGLFAEEEITLGSYVGEYTGIVRRNDRRYFEPLNNYCYEYPVDDEIGRSFVIDATQGNLTRFINHSSHPNLKPIHVFYGGYYHLIFIALQQIKKGEQLSYDYGENYWYLRSSPV